MKPKYMDIELFLKRQSNPKSTFNIWTLTSLSTGNHHSKSALNVFCGSSCNTRVVDPIQFNMQRLPYIHDVKVQDCESPDVSNDRGCIRNSDRNIASGFRRRSVVAPIYSSLAPIIQPVHSLSPIKHRAVTGCICPRF